METLQAIMTRRSVREFKNDPVTAEDRETLLRAAMFAPSATNQQPWHFIVIDDREILNRIGRGNPNAGMCVTAPLAILVCGDSTGLRSPGFWDQDCAAATQNLLLAAHDLGLGAVWTGAFPHQSLVSFYREMFSLPDEVTPLALIAVGHPLQPPEQENRFRPERIHRNRW